MGFDLLIQLHIEFNEQGIPCVWEEYDEYEYELIVFNPADFVVPKEYTRFLKLRGSLFSTYLELADIDLEDQSTNCVNLGVAYPSWEDISSSSEYEEFKDIWKEKDHDEFKEALSWFIDQDNFYFHWSY